MNRRSFFKRLMGGAAVVALPSLPVVQPSPPREAETVTHWLHGPSDYCYDDPTLQTKLGDAVECVKNGQRLFVGRVVHVSTAIVPKRASVGWESHVVQRVRAESAV